MKLAQKVKKSLENISPATWLDGILLLLLGWLWLALGQSQIYLKVPSLFGGDQQLPLYLLGLLPGLLCLSFLLIGPSWLGRGAAGLLALTWTGLLRSFPRQPAGALYLDWLGLRFQRPNLDRAESPQTLLPVVQEQPVQELAQNLVQAAGENSSSWLVTLAWSGLAVVALVGVGYLIYNYLDASSTVSQLGQIQQQAMAQTQDNLVTQLDLAGQVANHNGQFQAVAGILESCQTQLDQISEVAFQARELAGQNGGLDSAQVQEVVERALEPLRQELASLGRAQEMMEGILNLHHNALKMLGRGLGRLTELPLTRPIGGGTGSIRTLADLASQKPSLGPELAQLGTDLLNLLP